MIERRLCLLAAAAALSLGIAGEARAGCCPTCGCGPVIVAQPSQIYVVNQGPVFSGPGHHVRPASELMPEVLPGSYPYVGTVYTGYPYGYQDSGGYPRGLYSPFTGYPYAEPAPARVYWGRHRPYRRY